MGDGQSAAWVKDGVTASVHCMVRQALGSVGRVGVSRSDDLRAAVGQLASRHFSQVERHSTLQTLVRKVEAAGQ